VPEGGELRDAEFFGAGGRLKLQGGERRADGAGSGEGAKIVHQCFSFLRKTELGEFEEVPRIPDVKMSRFAGKLHGDKGGSDFRGRAKRAGGNFQGDARRSEILRQDGKIAVVAGSGPSSEAESDFELNDDMDFVDKGREFKEAVKNRRSDVVRQIAIKAKAATRGEGGQVGGENVGGDDGDVGEFAGEGLEAFGEARIQLDGIDRRAGGGEVAGHFAVAGADFDPAEGLLRR